MEPLMNKLLIVESISTMNSFVSILISPAFSEV